MKRALEKYKNSAFGSYVNRNQKYAPILFFMGGFIFDTLTLGRIDRVYDTLRQRIGAQVSGRNKVKKTLRRIEECLDDWDLNNGKATNKRIAAITGLAKKTIDKYSPRFREQKKLINKSCT